MSSINGRGVGRNLDPRNLDRCPTNPARCVPTNPVKTLEDVKKDLSGKLNSVTEELKGLPEDVKNEAAKLSEQVKDFTDKQIEVYKKMNEPLIDAANNLAAKFGNKEELSQRIIEATARLYQDAGGDDVGDCTLIVKAAIAIYCYTIKESDPDLCYLLMGSAITEAVPAACRLVLR
ncbi:hypothetical protein [Bacillus cereus]|uniref:hypothetical protein n=1 Tax=Bacillus cereus TaxID=1396 RepID=UPI000BF9AF5E|nr:hypothetical protein [Bacillus cereus]PFF53605.1 hypothetical protein CN350_27415 [Bacillus cereus]PFL15041.1 hypothetical protein COJ24_05905 [Bacillus cereus]